MSNVNVSKSAEVYNLLKKGLDAASLRSKTISNNIANINTKNYKRYYVSFEDTLKDANDNLNLKTTNQKHIKEGNEHGEVSVKQDTSTSTRQDGNNVDIDNEMANQAANTLMDYALVNQINSRLTLERYVVNEGRR